MYDFRTEDVIDFIRQNRVRKLLLQFADGLKPFSASVVEELVGEVKDLEIMVSGDSCYGACDVAFDEALCVGADGLVHYGHSPFPEAYTYARSFRVSVFFVEAFSKVEVVEVVERAIDMLGSIKGISKVGLTAPVQHVHELPLAKQLLEKEGYQVLIGTGSNRVKYPGQVLGCDYTAAIAVEDKVDAFLHIGGGVFHALGLSLTSQKPVILCDPYRREVKELSKEALRVRAIRMYYIMRAMDEARHYGIIIGCKWRQRHISSALRVKRLLERRGKKVTLISLREVSPYALNNIIGPDAFIITACPRIPIDDYGQYKRPILSILEALIVAGVLKTEEWILCDWSYNEKGFSNSTFKDR